VLSAHLITINRLLARKSFRPLASTHIARAPAQLKVLVDLCHLYGIAVIFDVVYNHAGGFFGDDHSIYFWDRASNGDNNHSLYCTNKGWAGGLAFALWNQYVRQFLINNASFFLNEFHVDGFRYDEISVLLSHGGDSSASFCRDLTGTLRFERPEQFVCPIARRDHSSALDGLAVWHEDDSIIPVQVFRSHLIKLSPHVSGAFSV
jgi:1,4-alpha-glucan branching enzyme